MAQWGLPKPQFPGLENGLQTSRILHGWGRDKTILKAVGTGSPGMTLAIQHSLWEAGGYNAEGRSADEGAAGCLGPRGTGRDDLTRCSGQECGGWGGGRAPAPYPWRSPHPHFPPSALASPRGPTFRRIAPSPFLPFLSQGRKGRRRPSARPLLPRRVYRSLPSVRGEQAKTPKLAASPRRSRGQRSESS